MRRDTLVNNTATIKSTRIKRFLSIFLKHPCSLSSSTTSLIFFLIVTTSLINDKVGLRRRMRLFILYTCFNYAVDFLYSVVGIWFFYVVICVDLLEGSWFMTYVIFVIFVIGFGFCCVINLVSFQLSLEVFQIL